MTRINYFLEIPRILLPNLLNNDFDVTWKCHNDSMEIIVATVYPVFVIYSYCLFASLCFIKIITHMNANK